VTTKSITWLALMVVGCILSAIITLDGIYIAMRVDLRQDSVLTGAYCLLPLLCFPVFLFLRRTRRAAVLAVMACVFLAAYSALSWRTCSELGYCGSTVSTVLQVLPTPPVLAFFAIAAIAFALSRIADRRSAESGR
jgi:hypothetical protein